jgi:uncharacterized SAM-binding protein YcdF (DUF218 family)
VFYFLSKILDLLLAPLTWSLVLVVLAMVWQRRPKGVKRAQLALFFSLSILVLFGLDPVSNRLVRALESSAVNERRPNVQYDAVVLLGGMLEDRVTATALAPSYNERAERLTMTYELLRSDVARYAIISGTSDVREAIEADVLADQLIRFGIAPDRIIREGRSRNTRENALLTQEIVRARGFQSVLVVTSAFHMLRAKGCFNAVGLAVDAYPVDYASYDASRFGQNWLPRASAFNMSTWALREWSGRLVYRLRGYTTDVVIHVAP